MADDFQTVRIASVTIASRRVAVDDVRGIDELAVDLARQRRSWPSPARYLRRPSSIETGSVVSALAAVWQSDYGHGDHSATKRTLPISETALRHLVGATGIEPVTPTMSR